MIYLDLKTLKIAQVYVQLTQTPQQQFLVGLACGPDWKIPKVAFLLWHHAMLTFCMGSKSIWSRICNFIQLQFCKRVLHNFKQYDNAVLQTWIFTFISIIVSGETLPFVQYALKVF